MLKRALLWSAVLMLAACGYQLRGHVSADALANKRVVFITQEPHRPFAKEVLFLLKRNTQYVEQGRHDWTMRATPVSYSKQAMGRTQQGIVLQEKIRARVAVSIMSSSGERVVDSVVLNETRMLDVQNRTGYETQMVELRVEMEEALAAKAFRLLVDSNDL